MHQLFGKSPSKLLRLSSAQAAPTKHVPPTKSKTNWTNSMPYRQYQAGLSFVQTAEGRKIPLMPQVNQPIDSNL